MAERAALITGASGGIGLAIAEVLGEEGYGLTLSARRPEKLEEAVAGLRDGGPRGPDVAANVADEEELKASSPPTRSATGASTCSSTTPASGSARRWTRSRPNSSTCSWR